MTATTRAAETLRSMIFDGTLGPNTDHLEADLAARLVMSRTPVREALARLEAQGLVRVRPRRGVRILGLSAQDMDEIYEVLTALESEAAFRAAKIGPPAVDLKPMQAAIEDMDHSLDRADLAAWAKADEAFHAALVRVCGNRRLAETSQMYADQVRRARAVTLNLRPFPQASNDDHRAVLQAIAEGQAEKARDLHYSHRARAREMLVQLILTHDLQSL